jgi:hypothetical protein
MIQAMPNSPMATLLVVEMIRAAAAAAAKDDADDCNVAVCVGECFCSEYLGYDRRHYQHQQHSNDPTTGSEVLMQ